MASDMFYADLSPLEQFLALANPNNYTDAPADWYALITDVVASTQAIAQGQYKEVNVLGASSIVAVLNAIAPLDVPFVFGEVLETIASIYGGGESYHPVAPAALNLSVNPGRLRAETKARAKSAQWGDRAQAYLETLVGLGLMAGKVQAGGVDWGQYKADVRAASDYQKIDDLLHMVIAGSPAQTEQLVRYLEDRLEKGHLTYGIHVSDRALMTCLIMDRRDRHFHLIDGADGGYALAAQRLKARLQGKVQNWQSYSRLAKRRPRRLGPPLSIQAGRD